MNKTSKSKREYHKGAMVGEKATPELIRLWQSLGILPSQTWTATKRTKLSFTKKVNPSKF